MKLRQVFFYVAAIAFAAFTQGCSDEEPEQKKFDYEFAHFHGSTYSQGNSVTVRSEKNPKSGQKHRSSDNFSTKGLKINGVTPSFMSVSCTDNITFKVNIDVKGGSDDEWAKEVYNGAILPYRSEDKFYIADPSGANSSFDVKFTAISPSADHIFVSSPGRCLNGQSHRASNNFQLPKSHTRYLVHISNSDVKFEIYEDVSAATDNVIAKNVGDGDYVNMSNDKRNYYLANVSNCKGSFQVLFEPVTVEWMSMLPDDMSLMNVSIPGTHDAGTYALEAINFGFSKCQNMSMAQQLDFGIRYFDLRVDVELLLGTMFITHGGLPCIVSFDDIIKDSKRFLEAHPKEVIIFELTAENDKMPEKFKEYLNSNEDIKKIFYLEETVPTLENARGKIVVLRRYALPASMSGEKWGLNFSGSGVWPDDGVKSSTTPDGIKYYIEDRFFSASSTDDHDTHEKSRLVNEAIDNIGSDTETLYLIFSSISASLGHTPYDFMWGGGTGKVSPEMSEALKDKLSGVTGDNAKKVGWIIMDYYNRDAHNDDCHVVERIINTNFAKNNRPFDISRLHSQYD